MRLLKRSWATLSFGLQIKAKYLCSYRHLLDAIVELHAMNGK